MKKLVTSSSVIVLLTLLLAIFLLAGIASAAPSYLVTDLGTLGGSGSEGSGINNSGQVTGDSWITGDVADHAFLYDGTTMHDLGTLGGSYSAGLAINNSGQVTGDSSPTGNHTYHAFLYSGGVMTDLGTLGSDYSTGYGINDSGQVTGVSDLTGGGTHAFLYSGGVMIDLGTLGGSESGGLGINNSGQVTGYSTLTGGATHAFLYSGGVMIDLGTLGGSYSAGWAINNSGQVTGGSRTASGDMHPFLYSGGVMIDLGAIGCCKSYGLGINSSGQVVGYASGTGFLYSGGTMYDLNSLIPPSSGWVLSGATGINDAGQITGFGIFNGQGHAYLLTPGAVVSVTTGTNVSVNLGPQVDLTFSDVTSAGTVTAIMVLPSNLSTPPANFSLSGTSSYDITTDASFTGPVTVCISYDPSKVTYPSLLSLYHYSNGTWTPLTNQAVNTATDQVCGQTSSFSVFAVFKPITVTGMYSDITNMIGQLLTEGCIDNNLVEDVLLSILSASQKATNSGNLKEAILILDLDNFITGILAHSGKEIASSCTVDGITFDPAQVLIQDVTALNDNLEVTANPNSVYGHVVNSSGAGISGATVSIVNSVGHTVTRTVTDALGFYLFPNTRVLTTGSTYTVQVAIPKGYTTSTPALQTFTWEGTAITLGNFVLN